MPDLVQHDWSDQFQEELVKLRPHLIGKILAAITVQEWLHHGKLAPAQAAQRWHKEQERAQRKRP